MLFAPPPLTLPNESSHNGSIEMVYQGSMQTIEPDSPETQTTNQVSAKASEDQTSQQRDGVDLAANVNEEPPVAQQRQQASPTTANLGHLETDSLSSKPTGILGNAIARTESKSDFRILCPSAVPSPLHKSGLHHAPIAATPMLRGGHGPGPAGVWPSPRTHKTIEDHFFMTNEHLDVVGKTTYDALDMYTKQQIGATNAKHELLTAILENHVKDLRSQISSVNEKTDITYEQTHNVDLKLDQLEKFIKDEIFAAMKDQMKKTIEMQSSLTDLKSTMTHMQQNLEELCAKKSGPPLSSSTAQPISGVSTSMPQTGPGHHSQPALTSYYGNEAGRDEPPPMPPLQDRAISNTFDAHSDARANYGTNWHAQGWNGRSSYHGRNKGDVSSYAGTNPYHYGNGGQYNNGYMSGYSYNFSPTSEQPYTYGQKPSQ